MSFTTLCIPLVQAHKIEELLIHTGKWYTPRIWSLESAYVHKRISDGRSFVKMIWKLWHLLSFIECHPIPVIWSVIRIPGSQPKHAWNSPIIGFYPRFAILRTYDNGQDCPTRMHCNAACFTYSQGPCTRYANTSPILKAGCWPIIWKTSTS